MADLHETFSYTFPSATTDRRTGTAFERDDVLLARITPCLENGKTALVKCREPGQVGIGSTEFIVLRGINVGPAYTYCFARDERVREHAIKSMSGSSGRQRVAANALEALNCVEPPKAVGQAFEEKAGPMLEQVFELQLQCRALAATRDLLLPRLVVGKIDVADLDLDSLLATDEAA
jgi:type I restriction enzyme S subunit